MLAVCDDPHSGNRRQTLGNYKSLARRFAECWLRVTIRIPGIGDSHLGITRFSPADSRNAGYVRRPAFRESATRSWELRDSRPPIPGMLAACNDPHSGNRRQTLGNHEILARRFPECWLRATTRIPRMGDSLLGITRFSPADSRNACCVRRPAFRESATRSWELRKSRPPIPGMLAVCDDPHSANRRQTLGNYGSPAFNVIMKKRLRYANENAENCDNHNRVAG
jgi:hypothetical protein